MSIRQHQQAAGMRGRRGSVLILSLWVVFFLAALAVAIGSHVSAVFSGAERLSARVRARAAAVAGAAQAAGVIMSQTNSWDGLPAGAWNRDETLFSEIELADEGMFSVVFPMVDGDGGVVTNVGVIGEQGKINLNTSHTNLLSALFVVAGGLSEADASALAAKVVAWRQIGDDERLTAGAASGYSARTRPEVESEPRHMTQIENLLQIEGMDVALFERLRPVVTVWGNADFVNVNAASETVLKALAVEGAKEKKVDLGVASSLAQKIVGVRRAGHAFQVWKYIEMLAVMDQFAPLGNEEKMVFSWMVTNRLEIKSTAFSGTAYSGEPAVGKPVLQVNFVWDTQARRFVMWQER